MNSEAVEEGKESLGGKNTQVSSSTASLDLLEEAETQPPTPVAIPELLKHPVTAESSAADADQKENSAEKDISKAEQSNEEPLVSIPLDPSEEPAIAESAAEATADNPAPPLQTSAAADRSQEESDAKPGTPETPLVGEKSLDSDAGTLVVHSSASESPPMVEDTESQLEPSAMIGSQVSGVSSANAYCTARGDPEKSNIGQGTPAGSRNLEESFEGISMEPKTSGRKPVEGGERSRPGVTSSPPRSPKAPPPRSPKASPPRSPKAGPLGEGGLGDSSGPGAFRQDSNNVAEELQEAEAKAEADALAASQRATTLREQPNKKGSSEEADGQVDAAPFTEENLQATEPRKVEASGEMKARPMSPPPAAPRPLQVSAEEVQSYEPPEYAGLVFHDGIDALGRPVVVVNAEALAPKSSRKDAISYMQQRLEPIIVQGPYVIVFLNSGSGSTSRLSPGWLASCYRQLSRPFRKNVKHVILVRPSATLKFMLAIVRPLLSPKAYVKVKKVASLSAMATATNSEVTMQHLGPRFAAVMGPERLAREASV